MNFNSNMPIYLQIMNKIKLDLISQKIDLGEKLPSTRELAITLNVNPNTTARVYKELEYEDLCHTKRGLGTYITASEEKIEFIKKEMANQLIDGFLKGMFQLGFSHNEILSSIQKNYNKEMLFDE